ncbi:MAG: preprotein translocase subunit SecE [Phycisphaerae bacterium]|nr:preprotein translocase subunit SecE [Phycisphaerae bacterium]
MKKVSWSSRAELVGSTIVVIVTVLVMAMYIFGVDTVLMTGLRWIGILASIS